MRKFMTAKQISEKLGVKEWFVKHNRKSIDFEQVIKLLFSNKSIREKKTALYKMDLTMYQQDFLWTKYMQTYHRKQMYISPDYLYYKDSRDNISTKDFVF